MTDYDLRTRKALRRVVLLEYGCGPDTLRRRKILPSLRQGQQRRPDGLHRLRRASARDDSL